MRIKLDENLPATLATALRPDDSLGEKYPYLTVWVKSGRSFEVGYTNSGHDCSFLRVIHYTELIWSSDHAYASLGECLAAMEAAIAQWCEEEGIQLDEL